MPSTRNTVNNADYGLTIQKIICKHYSLAINSHAERQFNSNYNEDYENELNAVIPKIFDDVGSEPIELLTYTDMLTDTTQSTSPHNFLLKNGKTLSIRTMKTSDKVAPRTVGQAGFEKLNDYFGDIYGKKIEDQEDIKDLMFNKIDETLPIFIDHLFLSDYTVLISQQSPDKYEIVNNDEISYASFSRNDFTFTRDLATWNESTTLRYHGKTIAEIQVHKHRTFKFRFKVTALGEWMNKIKYTTETLGISTEAAICELFDLQKPESFATRQSRSYIEKLKPVLRDAFDNMPPAISHTGSTPGERGGVSKCSYDFVLEGNKTLSVKSNKGKMICPPEVGQPGSETCFLYFSNFLPEGATEMTKENFKIMVYSHIDELIPIYINHLFDSDWLLWVYETKNGYGHKEISQDSIKEYIWKKEKFSFTKPSIENWNESNTVKYDGTSIGEFQVHNNRNCFKFRFNMQNLIDMILID